MPRPAGDFPDVERYREILSAFDLSRFPKLDKAMLRQVDDALSLDLPALMRQMVRRRGSVPPSALVSLFCSCSPSPGCAPSCQAGLAGSAAPHAFWWSSGAWRATGAAGCGGRS